MAWFGRKLAEVSPETPVAVAVKSELSQAEREEYLKLAGEVGVSDSPALLEEKLRAVLEAENIRQYDLQKVEKYLDKELGHDNWRWSAVRKRDEGWLESYALRVGDDVMLYFQRGCYEGKIPMPVLLTIKTIAEQVPEVAFFISERRRFQGDPFLLVIGRGTNPFVIERWDEPKFRG